MISTIYFLQIEAMGSRNTLGPWENLQVEADGHEKQNSKKGFRKGKRFLKNVKPRIESISLI
jgi:hypothetical protein